MIFFGIWHVLECLRRFFCQVFSNFDFSRHQSGTKEISIQMLQNQTLNMYKCFPEHHKSWNSGPWGKGCWSYGDHFQSWVKTNMIYITPAAARMMRMTMIRTITPIMIIIFMFFHQYFLATRVDVLWKESAEACRSSVFPIRSSNRSPLSRTLLMLSVRITFTSFTWLWTFSSFEAEAGSWPEAGWAGGYVSAISWYGCRPALGWYQRAKGSVFSKLVFAEQ